VRVAVHFLDAGAGDAAWAVFPDGSNVLVDWGPPDQSKQLLLAVQSAGVTTIDLLAPIPATSSIHARCGSRRMVACWRCKAIRLR
jgi:hypothetical protein